MSLPLLWATAMQRGMNEERQAASGERVNEESGKPQLIRSRRLFAVALHLRPSAPAYWHPADLRYVNAAR
jgi:hypothetical protein